jgi:O-acetyl-ADP-ribose deacetylase (regulator of RNase III)
MDGLIITVVQGSNLEMVAQAIVNAANSLGVMGGGVATGGVYARASVDVFPRSPVEYDPVILKVRCPCVAPNP